MSRYLEAERRVAGPGPLLGTRIGAALILVGCVCAALVAVTLVVGMPPIWTQLSDTLALMGAGWRVYNHQTPSVDFYCVVGPFPIAVLASGFHLEGGRGPGTHIALAILGSVLSVGALLSVRRRLTLFWGILFALSILALASAPVAIGMGGPPFGFRWNTSYTMLYNRLGWTALTLAVAAAVLPPRRETDGAVDFAGESGAWMGFCCGLAALSKINFLLGAGATFVFAVGMRRSSPGIRKYVLTAAAGLAIAVALLEVWPGGVFGYVGDMLTLLRVKREESYLGTFGERLHLNAYWTFALIGVTAWVLAASAPARRDGRRAEALSAIVSIAFTIGVSYLVGGFNRAEGPQMPALIVAALLLVRLAQGAWWPQGGAEGVGADGVVRVAMVKAVALVFMLNYLAFDAGSTLYGWLWNRTSGRNPAALANRIPLPILDRIPIPVAADEQADPRLVPGEIRSMKYYQMLAPGTPTWTSFQLSKIIEDGTALARRNLRKGDRIWGMEWPDPYSMALHIAPPRGGALLWDYGRMVDDRVHPGVDFVTSDVSLIMYPKPRYGSGQTAFYLRTYIDAPEAGGRFARVDESDFWILLRRTKG